MHTVTERASEPALPGTKGTLTRFLTLSARGLKMVRGYSLSAPDCGVEFLHAAPSNLFCIACGGFVAGQYYFPQLDMSSVSVSFCFTYDNRLLVSERGRDFLISNAKNRVEFHQIDKTGHYFFCSAQETLSFDFVGRKSRLENWCELCGEFENVIGATPAFIHADCVIEPLGFYRTDLCFGSGREKSPLSIVGDLLKEKLGKEFPELEFLPVVQVGIK